MEKKQFFNLIPEKHKSADFSIKLSDICKVLKAEMPCADTEIQLVTANLKAVKKNTLYFLFTDKVEDPLKSLKDAMAMGAVSVVSDKPIKGVPCIGVKDIYASFYVVSAFFARKLKMHTVAITGSVGKTTAKEMTALVLSQKAKTIKSLGADITPFGVSETILAADRTAEYIVLDMDAKKEQHLSMSSKIAKPEITVITNIGLANIEYLESQEGILCSKLEILDGMESGGYILLNCDDPMLAVVEIDGCNRISYGMKNTNVDFYADDVVSTNDSVSFNINHGNEFTPIKLSVFGEHNVYNALIAFIIGTLNGIPAETIANVLATYKISDYHQTITGKLGITLISDCCNTAPDSIKIALQTLKDLKTVENGRKIVVLSDLIGISDVAPKLHRVVGKMLSAYGVDMVFCYGDNAAYIAEEAIASGIPALKFDTLTTLLEVLVLNVKKNDILLYKGIEGTRMERLMKAAFTEPLASHGSVFTARYMPVYADNFIKNEIRSPYALLYDMGTDTVLLEKNASDRVNPGCVLNVLIAVIAIEYGNLDDIVFVSETALLPDIQRRNVTFTLEVGESFILRDLVYACVLANNPDAVNVIAEHIFGSIENALSFINAKAKQLGCMNSNFEVVHGYSNNENHYSTSEDMLKIVKYAVSNTTFCSIAKTVNYFIEPTNIYPEKRELVTQNCLQNPKKPSFYPYATGLKSGKPNGEGYVLAATAENAGRKLIALLFGAPVEDGTALTYVDANKMFRYAFFNYEKLTSPEM